MRTDPCRDPWPDTALPDPTPSTPDPLAGPIHHDTDAAPPPSGAAEELACQRRIVAIDHDTGYTRDVARQDCAAQFNTWMARKAQRPGAVGEHFRAEAKTPVTASEVTYAVDRGLYYAYVDRDGIDDVTSDVGEDSELAAYARLAAYLETDGVRS